MRQDMATAAANETLKVSPVVAVAGASLFGLGLQDWVYVVTILYVVLQSAFLIFRWVKGRWRKGDE